MGAATAEDAAKPVAAGSKSGAVMNIRKTLWRRRQGMAEHAMLSPNTAFMPDFGGGGL